MRLSLLTRLFERGGIVVMAGVKLTFQGKLCGTYKIDQGMSLTIGRRGNNDIVIQDSVVSREHARIESLSGRYLLTDLQSKNGTYVNKAPVTSHQLKDGDMVKIGKHRLVFLCDDVGPPWGSRVPMAGKPAFMDHETLMQREGISTIDSRQAPPAARVETVGVLAFLTGGEGRIVLTKDLIKVGRDPSCDIVVRGLLIGKIAFTINLRPNGYYLSFVGGTTVPKVSRQTVRRSVKLEEHDIIEIGSTKLQFLTRKQTLGSNL